MSDITSIWFLAFYRRLCSLAGNLWQLSRFYVVKEHIISTAINGIKNYRPCVDLESKCKATVWNSSKSTTEHNATYLSFWFIQQKEQKSVFPWRGAKEENKCEGCVLEKNVLCKNVIAKGLSVFCSFHSILSSFTICFNKKKKNWKMFKIT